MRADNRGEGGILALVALVVPRTGPLSGGSRILPLLGVFGASLLYGDGMITPAISVLSAVEGLQVATPAFESWVVPTTVGILVALFSIQSRGTSRVGRLFGPVMVVWFATLALLGVRGIAQDPSVLAALAPWYAFRFLADAGVHGFLVLGAVFLVVTGGEALYADMGHFGKRPIRVAWFGLVLPALIINYFGQGALLLTQPEAASNPFYGLVPRTVLYPMVVVATAAAIVASQALISGAFSLTQQAVQLGYCPRVTIKHTSYTERGQIYIPEVNWWLMVACIALVATFKTSSHLASAYGIAVTGTMTITTLLFYKVTRERWGWSRLQSGALTSLFLVVDLAFLSANLIKVEQGGWFPLVLAGIIYTLMSTWKLGRRRLNEIMEEISLPMDLFLGDVAKRIPTRVPGTAVFMTSNAGGAPPVLLHHVKHNKVLHHQVILLSVTTEEIPQVPEEERLEFSDLGQKFYALRAHYGFMESPDVPAALRLIQSRGVTVRPLETTFYLGRESLIPVAPRAATAEDGAPPRKRMAMWRKRLFVLMSRNAQTATAFFGLPPNRVVEMGAQIQF